MRSNNVKPNRFGKKAAITLFLLSCQCNDFLQTSQPASIETSAGKGKCLEAEAAGEGEESGEGASAMTL